VKQGLVRLDLNNAEFQSQLFELSKDQQRAVLNTLRKTSAMSWEQIYRDTGLNWEAVASQVGPDGQRVYSFRIGKAFRAIAFRDGMWMRIQSLHPDHDSAYR